MRCLAETANVSQPLAEAVAGHLGHSTKTRDQHYSFENNEKTILAADRLLHVMEEEGESEDQEVDDSHKIDPVRNYFHAQNPTLSFQLGSSKIISPQFSSNRILCMSVSVCLCLSH